MCYTPEGSQYLASNSWNLKISVLIGSSSENILYSGTPTNNQEITVTFSKGSYTRLNFTVFATNQTQSYINFNISGLTSGTYTIKLKFTYYAPITDINKSRIRLVDILLYSGTNAYTFESWQSPIAMGRDIGTSVQTNLGTYEIVKYSSSQGQAYYKYTKSSATGEFTEYVDLVTYPSQSYSNEQAIRYVDLDV